jgi:triacylglycerol esterase/lipase EstA (alpha/beta hydrolase family)
MSLSKVVGITTDILSLPVAGVLLGYSAYANYYGISMDDINIMSTKNPILLIHGSGFNESEWIVGKQFLKRAGHDKLFSVNYDNYIFEKDQTKGFDESALIIRDKIREIKKLVGSNEIILIGHSMGGLIASFYAEYMAFDEEIVVNKIITISSPFNGSPLLDTAQTYSKYLPKVVLSKRNQQMSSMDVDSTRTNLVKKIRKSESDGVRKYFCIWSTGDFAVSNGCVVSDESRQLKLDYVGHYTVIASKRAWDKIILWLSQ